MDIDPRKRYQTGLGIAHMYPVRNDGICACGCEKKLPKRKRRWATKECQKNALRNFLIVKGDQRVIKQALKTRDNGICQECGLACKTDDEWHADHIIEVRHGGGGCGLDNFQTLCIECHKLKTLKNYKQYYGNRRR